MSKANYKNKDKEKGIIPLANGWAIIAPCHVDDSKDLLVAIGSLVTMYAFGAKEANIEKQTLKDMIGSYIDSIWDEKLPDGLFIKNKKGGKIDKKVSGGIKNENN